MEKNNKNGGQFFKGFLWGVAIGAGVVYFLKSEKGKEILNNLKDEGIDQLAQMGEAIQEEEALANQDAEENNISGHDYSPGVKNETIKVLHVHTGQVDTEVDTKKAKEHTEKKSPPRKFFKGIKK